MAGAGPQTLLGVQGQPRLLPGGRSLELTGRELSVSADGRVRVHGPPVNVTVLGLPRVVNRITEKNTIWNSTTVPAAQDRLAQATLAVGPGVWDGSTVLALLQVTYSDCVGSKTDPCSYVLCIESRSGGRTWRPRSVVTDAGNEAALARLDDGRLLAVLRHDCELANSSMAAWNYKQLFSSDSGRTPSHPLYARGLALGQPQPTCLAAAATPVSVTFRQQGARYAMARPGSHAVVRQAQAIHRHAAFGRQPAREWLGGRCPPILLDP